LVASWYAFNAPLLSPVPPHFSPPPPHFSPPTPHRGRRCLTPHASSPLFAPLQLALTCKGMRASQQAVREGCTRRKRGNAVGRQGNEARGMRVHTQGTTAVGKVKVEQARLFWRQVGLLLEIPCEVARGAPRRQHWCCQGLRLPLRPAPCATLTRLHAYPGPTLLLMLTSLSEANLPLRSKVEAL